MADAPNLPPPPARYPTRAAAGDAPAGDGAPDRALADLSRPVLALPPHGGKLERIEQHTKGLVDDAKEWVELRVKLAQAEVETFVQKKVQTLVMRMVPLIAGAIGGLFLLVTIALFLGWWLGHAAWGFLIVTVLLLGVAGFLLYKNRDTLENPLQGAEVESGKAH